MHIRCWSELVQYGANDFLKREYGSLMKGQAEPEYNISLQIDLEQIPAEGGGCVIIPYFTDSIKIEERDAFIKSIALVKRNALAAPFELAFKHQKELEASGRSQGDLMQIHYRDEEAIYVQASPDRVTVIFSTVFREETDRIFGKVFLQVSMLLVDL
jgi:actin related protein 2/3 complex subunit 2